MQLKLEIPERRENNPDSQNILDSNREHFSNQCCLLLTAMLKGEKITTSSALLKYSVGDARARIRDLIKAGVEITKELREDRFKVYYMTPEQIQNYLKQRA